MDIFRLHLYITLWLKSCSNRQTRGPQQVNHPSTKLHYRRQATYRRSALRCQSEGRRIILICARAYNYKGYRHLTFQSGDLLTKRGRLPWSTRPIISSCLHHDEHRLQQEAVLQVLQNPLSLQNLHPHATRESSRDHLQCQRLHLHLLRSHILMIRMNPITRQKNSQQLP
jgi:hypothetical protein